MNTNIYDGLNYTTGEINRTFKIKVNGVNFEGKKLNVLVGVSGLIKLIGVVLVNKLLNGLSNARATKRFASCAGV